jgi:hypothetical protein
MPEWKFIPDPPDQSSSDSDWYALTAGYLNPEEILADPEQIEAVRAAESLLESFFEAVREAGIRTEM